MPESPPIEESTIPAIQTEAGLLTHSRLGCWSTILCFLHPVGQHWLTWGSREEEDREHRGWHSTVGSFKRLSLTARCGPSSLPPWETSRFIVHVGNPLEGLSDASLGKQQSTHTGSNGRFTSRRRTCALTWKPP